MHQPEPAFAAARWIWSADCTTVNQYVDFFTSFELDSRPEAAALFISADSGYSVCVNGCLLDGGQYPDYPEEKIYNMADLHPYLRGGRNTLAIVGYCQNEDSSVYRKGRPGLWFAVTANEKTVAVSGTQVWCRPSPCYRSGAVEKFSGQLSYAFRYNAAGEDGWMTCGARRRAELPGGGWQNAQEVAFGGVLRERPILPLAVDPPQPVTVRSQGVFWDTEGADAPMGTRLQHAALAFRESKTLCGAPEQTVLPAAEGLTLHRSEGDGVYLLLDLGRECAGLFTLELAVPESAEVLVGFGEQLDDLRVRSSVGGREFAVAYHACAGRRTFTHPFKRLGCRYLQLHVFAPEVTVYYAGVRPVHYPVTLRPMPDCGDRLHNRIAQVCRDTLLLCMHEHYEDCPWREQALYAMDSRNQMLCGYTAFRNPEFPRACLRLMALGQQPDGLLELCAPARVAVRIPAFSLSFVTALYEYVQHTGDRMLSAELWPVTEKIFAAFERRAEADGLVSRFPAHGDWNFYEWQPGLDGDNGLARTAEGEKALSLDAPLNAMLLRALEECAALGDELGKAEAAAGYRARARQLRTACARFWDEKRQRFATYLDSSGRRSHYCELTQALLLIAGVGDTVQRAAVLDVLATGENGLIPVTLSCALFKYEALLAQGDRYRAAVLDEIAEIWGGMLFSGATSFWETARGAWDFDRAGSLCHAWSSIPLYVYARCFGTEPQTAK